MPKKQENNLQLGFTSYLQNAYVVDLAGTITVCDSYQSLQYSSTYSLNGYITIHSLIRLFLFTTASCQKCMAMLLHG